MAVFRLIATLLGLGFLLCMAAHTLSGDAIWRARAMQLAKWGVVLCMVFIGVLVLRRGAVFV